MVGTRGKKIGGLKKTKNKAAENASTEKQTSNSLAVGVEGQKLGVEPEDKEEITVDKDRNKEYELIYAEETEKVTSVDHNDENAIEKETYGEAESEKNSSEDDEIDDHEDAMWEDDDEDSEDKVENFDDTDKVGEDEAIEGQDDDWDGSSEEQATGEEDSEEIEYSEEESMEDGYEEDTQKGEELAKVVGQDTEENNVRKVKISSKKMEESSEKSGKSKKRDESNEKSGKSKKLEESTEKSGKLKKTEESSERGRKKVQVQMREKVELRDRPESSSKRKAKKRVESMGMIFMCSTKTKSDCYQYRVFGLPESKKDIVEKIYAGMRLFLYDVDLKLLYGIYKAAGPGGFNIEPKAFKSQFPSQVRFKILDNCLPLEEEKFKEVIKDNYFTNTKFDCQLNSEQVKKLCKLFIATSKGKRSKTFSRLKSEKRHRKQIRKQRVGDKRRISLKEDLRYRERSRKRSRKAISSVVPSRRTPPAPLSPTLPVHAYGRTNDVDPYRRDSYLDSRSHYRERRDPIVSRRDWYRDLPDVSTEHDRYSDRHDRNPVSRYPDRDERDPYILRRDPYRDATEAYPERRDPYKEDRDPYLERRLPRDRRDSYIGQSDPFRDARDPYMRIRDSYRDGRDSYLDRHGSYVDRTYLVPYTTNKRDPLSDRDDVYQEAQGVDYRDSYRRGIASRDSYTAYERSSYAEPVYSSEYPYHAGPAREYHLRTSG